MNEKSSKNWGVWLMVIPAIVVMYGVTYPPVVIKRMHSSRPRKG
jgi:hypothetical protein